MSIGTVVALIQQYAPGVSPSVIEQAVSDWLDDHPEATTTVEDGSITEEKLAADLAAMLSNMGDDVTQLKSAINSTASDVNEISEAYGTSRNIFDDTELKAGSGITFSNGEYSGTADALYNIGKMMDGDFEQDTRYTFSLYAFRYSGNKSTENGLCIQIVHSDNSTKTTPIPNETDEYARFAVTSDSGKSVSGIRFTYDQGMNNVWHLKMIQVEKGASATEYVSPDGSGFSAVDKVARGNIISIGDDVEQINDKIRENVPGWEDLSAGFISGHYIKTAVSVGATVDLTPIESSTYTSCVGDCEAGDTCIITAVGGGNARAWAFIDGQNKLISVSESYNVINNYSIVAPAGAKKIIVGAEETSPHILKHSVIVSVPVDIKKVYKSFVDSEQMFDRSTVIAGKKYSNGIIVDDSDFYLSDFIKIEASTNYTYRGVNGAVNYFDENKEYLSAVTFNGYDQPETRTSVAGASYCRIQLQKEYYPYEAVLMNKGTTGSKQFIYGKLLKDQNMEFRSYAYSDMPIPTEYTAIGVKAVDGSTGTDFDNDNPSLSAVYDAFDELVEEFPDYVSKSDLGMDQSNTYHIYAYYFTPEEMTAGSTYYRLPYPKINLLSGIHGSRECCENIFAVYYLMKSLCENWNESDALEYLRWNVRFAVVPIQNPYGFVNGTRGNSRDVDLNRNFGIGWKSTTQGSGSAPMSEAETNIIAAFGEANKDAIFTVDLHGTGNEPVGQDSMIYVGTGPTDEIFYMLKSVMTKVSHLWDSQNIAGLNKANFHGFISGSIEGDGMERVYMHDAVGISSCVLESFMNFSGSQYSDNSEEIMQMNADKLGYFILYGLMHFKK